jgi:hypothetical protein
MADGNKQTNQPVKKFKVKFVGGGRYDLASFYQKLRVALEGAHFVEVQCLSN